MADKTNDDPRRLTIDIPKGSTVGVWFRNHLREIEVVGEHGERIFFEPELPEEVRTILVGNLLLQLPDKAEE